MHRRTELYVSLQPPLYKYLSRGPFRAQGKMDPHYMCSILMLAMVVWRPCTAQISFDRMLIFSFPNQDPSTIPYDPSLGLGTPDLPMNDSRLAKAAPGCRPEQVRLTYWGASQVLVSWSTCDATVSEKVSVLPTKGIQAPTVQYGTAPGQYTSTAKGAITSYVYDYSAAIFTPRLSYASPLIHHVLLTGLKPGVTYHYKIANPMDKRQSGGMSLKGSQEFSFKMVQPSFPIRLGIMADPGQTSNSSDTIEGMRQAKPDLVMLVGDFTYADTYYTNGSRSEEWWFASTYQPRWDSWGRLLQPLLSQVPFLHSNGNHEIEPLPNGELMTAYNHRYPVPSGLGAPTSFGPVTRANPTRNLYYSVQLAPGIKVLSITSYIPNDTFAPDTAQYKWLEAELKNIDRAITPWVIVQMHAPWYTSYTGHYQEAECMRQTYEPLLVKYNVDLVFSGHVHAYERSKPVVNWKLDNCGPAHITIGDAGNVEGLYHRFIDDSPQPEWCKDNGKNWKPYSYQPQRCLSLQDGRLCYQQQPPWSAFRSPSFGFGVLEVRNATHAYWKWQANKRGGALVDGALFVRNRDCGKAKGAALPVSG